MKDLVLASTSVYRADQLRKIGIPFETIKPIFDEDAKKKILLQQQASPLEIAEALSKGKAKSIQLDNVTLLAGDQIVSVDDIIFGKSYEFKSAFDQLKLMQGRTHQLITATTILNDHNE